MAGAFDGFAPVVAAEKNVIPLDVWIETIVKLIGAGGGAALSLVYFPPSSFADFSRRTAAALIFGILLTAWTRSWLGFGSGIEASAGAACLTAFVSWPAMGALWRAADKWGWDAIKRFISRKP